MTTSDLQRIFRATAAVTGVPESVLYANRTLLAHYELARNIACYVAHHAGASYPQIGRLTRRHHTTVMDAIRRIDAHKHERIVASLIAAVECQLANET